MDSQLIKLSFQKSHTHRYTGRKRDSRKITILAIPFNTSLHSIRLTLRQPSVAWWWAFSVARCSRKSICASVYEDVDGLSAQGLQGMKRASQRGERRQKTLAPMGSPNTTAACPLDSFSGSPHACCQPLCTHRCA